MTKSIKPYIYTPGEKIWLDSKHIKTKQIWKLKAKFFEPFRVFHLVGKQAYKLKLPARWKIHDVYHVLLLELNIIRKRRVNKLLDMEPELDVGENKH